MRLDPRHVAAALLGVGLLGLTAAPAAAQKNPLRDAFFGETHVHTSWSFDAYIFGNTMTGPADAYKYAKGETIKHPLGYPIKITTPLDWMGVTDHSEYVGTIRLANTPGSAISKLPIAEKLKVRDLADIQRIYLWLGYSTIDMKPVKELVVPEVAGTVWKENVAIADRANQPGKFTAFCSYEWTSTPDNRNMHRNVFFKDCAKVDGQIPQPAQIGDVMHSGEMGAPSSYAIKDGKIVTSIGNQGYEVTVYKLGDKYFGARSNEFGYANYEVEPTPANLVDLGKERSPF